MPNTFELIASSTVGSGGAAEINFTSIPSTYTDLVVKLSARNTNAQSSIEVRIKMNNVTTSLSSRVLYGDGSAAASANNTDYIASIVTAGNDTASTFSNSEFYLPNYAGSSNKSVSADGVSERNGTLAYTYLTAGLWANTAAINQVGLYFSSGNFAEFSTAYLYGVKNA
jgi:hypothetical protein